jgi:hypothetical protein
MALAGIETAPDALPTSAHGRELPDAAAIDPDKVVVSYDRPTDTLFIHLYGRGREAVSEVGGDYWYTLVDLRTDEVLGFQIEDFLERAVAIDPELLELLEITEVDGRTAGELRRRGYPIRAGGGAEAKGAHERAAMERRKRELIARLLTRRPPFPDRPAAA